MATPQRCLMCNGVGVPGTNTRRSVNDARRQSDEPERLNVHKGRVGWATCALYKRVKII